MPTPLVSVVLIFLDAERFIEEAVRSVLSQTLEDWELILVDDGSSDRSRAIAHDFASSDKRIRYVDHPDHRNLGRSASRNVGAEESTGKYLAFLDADDVWDPDKLAEQVHLLETMSEVALVCGALLYWNSWDPGRPAPDRLVLTGGIADRLLPPPEAAVRLYPLGRAAGAGVDCMVRRDRFEEVGGFEDRFHGLYDDQAFLLKIFLRYPVYISSRPWLRYRQHDASCCAVATRSDAEYRRLRRSFLDWLHSYVQRTGLGGREVRSALRRALLALRKAALSDMLRALARRLLKARPA